MLLLFSFFSFYASKYSFGKWGNLNFQRLTKYTCLQIINASSPTDFILSIKSQNILFINKKYKSSPVTKHWILKPTVWYIYMVSIIYISEWNIYTVSFRSKNHLNYFCKQIILIVGQKRILGNYLKGKIIHSQKSIFDAYLYICLMFAWTAF